MRLLPLNLYNMQWSDLSRQEKEQLASQFGVSCSGDMETTSEELKKVPASAWEDLENRRQLKRELEEKRLKDLADKEKSKVKAEKKEEKKSKKELKLGAKKKK